MTDTGKKEGLAWYCSPGQEKNTERCIAQHSMVSGHTQSEQQLQLPKLVFIPKEAGMKKLKEKAGQFRTITQNKLNKAEVN